MWYTAYIYIYTNRIQYISKNDNKENYVLRNEVILTNLEVPFSFKKKKW